MLLVICLKQYRAALQVMAALLVLVVVLSAALQHLLYQDNKHNMIEMLGIQACLLQLTVVLLCNLVQDKGGQGSNDCLGPNSTAFLIFVVFRLMLVFFGMMVQAMVCGSLEMKGVMGKLARVMAQCCWVEPERGTGGHCGED